MLGKDRQYHLIDSNGNLEMISLDCPNRSLPFERETFRAFECLECLMCFFSEGLLVYTNFIRVFCGFLALFLREIEEMPGNNESNLFLIWLRIEFDLKWELFLMVKMWRLNFRPDLGLIWLIYLSFCWKCLRVAYFMFIKIWYKFLMICEISQQILDFCIRYYI